MMMNKIPQPPLAAIERKFSKLSAVDSYIEIENIKNVQEKRVDMPSAIKTLIKRRCDALKQNFNPMPQTGQIVLIDAQTISPQKLKSSDDFYLNDPLLVLLDSVVKESESQWQGWLVAQETDYAGDWDFFLDPTLDAPLDPLAGMVQVWNRVTLQADFISRVVGELTPERLVQIDALAQRYRRYQQQNSQQAEFTDDDPRHRYQQLYWQAAHYLTNAVAAVTVEKTPTSLSLNQWLQPLFLQADAIKRSIVPQVNYAMGDGEEKNNDLLLDQSLRIQASKRMLNDGSNSYLIKMTIRLEQQPNHSEHSSHTNYSIEFSEDGNLEHYSELSASEPATHFMRNPTSDDSQLVIRDEDNNVVHRFFL